MKNPPPSLSLLARLLAGGVLVFSGYMKLMAPAEELSLVIEGYRLVPVSAALALARVLPWAELFTGAALLTGYCTRLAAAGAAGLFGLFIAALAQAALRGLALDDCGCFGQGGPHLARGQAVAFDALLLAAALAAWFDRRPRWSLDGWISKK